MPDTTTSSARKPKVGERVTLASYTTRGGGLREIVGQRVNGVVRVVDVPAGAARGRRYLIERGLTEKAQLDALVADYVEQSQRRGRPAIIVDLADYAQ